MFELRNKEGAVLASNDDGPTTIDPRLEFTRSGGLDVVTVALRDTVEIANEQAIYGLSSP